MKISKYLKDKKLSMIVFIACFFIMSGMFWAFRIPKQLMIAVAIVYFLMGICLIAIDLFRKKKFYDELVNNTNALDQKYLVLETLEKPDFYEGEILYENMYEINKSMVEKMGDYRENIDDLLENEISITVNTNGYKVMTDAKWIEFILNQIINNSIKYKRSDIDSMIKIQAKEDAGSIYLSIYDNGIGIPSKDVASVFKKSFTGENGRKGAKSTGMGLYIAKKLCVKLGHKIEISSKENQWTQVTIIFGKNDYYKFEK